MIHIPEEQTQHYMRQIIIITSISYYYYYYNRIILNVHKINKPRYIRKVSHLQHHSP